MGGRWLNIGRPLDYAGTSKVIRSRERFGWCSMYISCYYKMFECNGASAVLRVRIADYRIPSGTTADVVDGKRVA